MLGVSRYAWHGSMIQLCMHNVSGVNKKVQKQKKKSSKIPRDNLKKKWAPSKVQMYIQNGISIDSQRIVSVVFLALSVARVFSELTKV